MPSAAEAPARLSITRLGAAGDGLAQWPDGTPAFVPGTLPGETVLARPAGRRGPGRLGKVATILDPAPDRVAPPCPHAGTCGGCVLQHAGAARAAAFKTGLLADALARAGFPPRLGTLRTVPAESRRRLDLAVRRQGGATRLGLHAAGAPLVIELQACPVARPEITSLFAPLRAVLGRIEGLRREGSVLINHLDNGPDLLLRTDLPLSLADRQILIAFARAAGLPRLSWAWKDGPAETVAQWQPPSLRVAGGGTVLPPPGAFLQAAAEGEAAIVAAVLAALPDRLAARARLIELFAGLGSLSFALAGRARVAAFEGDAEAVAALRRAAAGHRIEAVRRDLARQPLQPAELRGAAAVVLDPPFAGAGPQIPPLVASGVPLIVYVSCNPAALAADLAPFRAAGYDLAGAVPVDQFLWSAQIESVITLRRPG